MTTPENPPPSPESFAELARRIAEAGDDEQAAEIFRRSTALTGDPVTDRDELRRRREELRSRAALPFDCSAYNAAQTSALDAVCFFGGGPGLRLCAGRGECDQRMSVERQRVFRAIQANAAAGGTHAAAWEHLAAQFTHPDQLLNVDAPPRDEQT